MNTTHDKELAFGKRLAVKAKQISDKYFKTNLDFKTKADATPVTVADELINQLVIDGVQKDFPGDGVIGEEQSWNSGKDRNWVCDPIDGTIAFSMGMPTFMFSLALVDNGQPVIAVTSELATGRIFWASVGNGAFVDNKRMSVSQRKIGETWLALDSDLETLYGNKPFYTQLSKLAYQKTIIHGSVYKGMLVAQGFADATASPRSIYPWDEAAVKLIVEEAGGRVTDKDGKDQKYDKKLNGIIVSNGIVHQAILDSVRTSATNKN